MTAASSAAMSDAIRALAREVTVAILDGESSQPAAVEEPAVATDLGQGAARESIRSSRGSMTDALRGICDR